MKLKVAETMDVEEVPQKLAKMMEHIKMSVVNELTLCDPVASAIVSTATHGGDFKAARDHVLAMRGHLYNIDVKLEDVAMILSGLEKILEEQAAQELASYSLAKKQESDDS
jgi:hypothetical protein